MTNQFEKINNGPETPKPSRESIFRQNEIFDPEIELENIKKMATDKKEKTVETYKRKLLAQKIGINKMIVEISDKVLKNKDISLGELLNFLKSDFLKYALSNDQIEKFKDCLELFVRKRDYIFDFYQDCLDSNKEINTKKLFIKIFNFSPHDEVNASILPAAICFDIKNQDDYSFIQTGAYLDGHEINEREKNVASNSGASLIINYPDENLKGSIIIKSPICFYDENISNQMERHEFRHVINAIIGEFQHPEYKLYEKDENIFKGLEKKKFLCNCFIEDRIKDEILTYYDQAYNPQWISKNILAESSIYNYGKSYNSDLGANIKKFSPEYLKMVENGIVSFARLRESGLTDEEAQALLIIEPLIYWPRIVDRFLGLGKTSSKEKKDNLKRLIDGRILRKFKNKNQ